MNKSNGLTLTALLALCAGAQAQPAGSSCADVTTAHMRLPEPALCWQRAKPAVAGTTASERANLLFSRFRQQLADGHLEAAESSLDCADAIIGNPGDPALRYQLVRQRGILDFRRELIPQALSRFECAVELSTARGDSMALARDLSNQGAALRRLGDFHGALRSLTRSLQIQRSRGAVSGAVLTNIGDVYRDLDEADNAMRYYGDAYSVFLDQGNRIEAAHVRETMAEQSLTAGDTVQALDWLQQALSVYRAEDNRIYQLRVHDGLIQAALAQADTAQAQKWSAAALALADAAKLTLPTELQLQIARTDRLTGRLAAAIVRLDTTLTTLEPNDPSRVSLLEEIAAAQESRGNLLAANAALREARRHAESLSRLRHDRQLDWLRVRFESAEQQRAIALLESESRLQQAVLRQRTLLIWFILASAVCMLFGLWLWLQRRRQQQHLKEEARRIHQQEELCRYRREASLLVEDRSLLQALLDSRQQALCLLDADGQLLAANQSGRKRLGLDNKDRLNGSSIFSLAAETAHPVLSAALEQMEDNAVQQFELVTQHGLSIIARLEPWNGGNGMVVLVLQDLDTSQHPVATEVVECKHAVDNEPGSRDAFRRTLVELMLGLVEAWEQATGTSRLELAEKSRIWRVNIDDGRLRARAMERYLSVSRLPSNPRWRDVLRSAYFVLGHCNNLSEKTRADLQAGVDGVLAYTRRDALV